MDKLPPLAALRAFEAAARHLSFKNAATELAVTPTAISHQVKLLEQVMGVRLFDRRPRRVTLTDAGRELQPVLTQSFDTILRTTARLSTGNTQRRVTLTATTAFTAQWLVPRLGRFRRAHPDIVLRLLPSDDPVDLTGREADCAVRYGSGPYPGHQARLLFRDTFAPLCAPHLCPADISALPDQALLHAEWRRPDGVAPTWQRWWRAAGLAGSPPRGGTVLTDDAQLIQAVLAGQGIALLSTVLTIDQRKRNLLRQPFGPELSGHSHHFIYPEHRATAEVEAVGAWLATECAAIPTLPPDAPPKTHHGASSP